MGAARNTKISSRQTLIKMATQNAPIIFGALVRSKTMQIVEIHPRQHTHANIFILELSSTKLDFQNISWRR
jgi:hypothetical protein